MAAGGRDARQYRVKARRAAQAAGRLAVDIRDDGLGCSDRTVDAD